MARLSERWFLRPQIWIEAFAILNLGFLTFDIYLAHSVNQFRNQAEFIPLIFSATAPLFLSLGLTLGYRRPAAGNLREPSVHPFDNFIYGAPPMAPLLFPNLRVLGIVALWQLRSIVLTEPAHC
jgi:hypothetical protein